MNVAVNGEMERIPDGATVEQLLKRLNADGRRVAALVNDTVVGADTRAAYVLKDGDRVEVLTLAGGG